MQTKQVPVLWACFLLWNLYIASSQTVYPGIKARITQHALDYGLQVAVKMMEQMAKDIVIPDLKGSESLEFLKIDYVKYNFSNITINAFSLPNTSLAFVPGVGIRALSNHGTANISTNWEVKAPLFQDSGAADLFLSGIYFTGIIVLTRNDLGHPALELQDCHAQVSHAQVSFSGGLSVLYNSFAEPMEKPILRNLNEMLCPIATNEVEALSVNLSALEVLTKIDNYTVLDCSLISPPEITENYLDLNLKGAFYPLESLVDPPFLPAPFELPKNRDSMLYIGISEYFFKSASFAHFVSGALGAMLSTKEISNYFSQNTQGIGSVLSKIAEIYVLSQPFMLQIMATGPPVIDLHPNNFSLEFPASVVMLTQLENSTIKPIVSMDFVASTNVGLAILGQKLICSLSLNRFRLSLPENSHRDVKVVRFENILSSILHFGVLPLANTKLQQGFPLPNPYNISFINSDIEVLEGFLLISTDLTHETSSKQQPNHHSWGGLNLVNGPWRGQPNH
ncbi:BPI fold-containing family C protein [Meriones unguiculatus]|uniref:BPI fold-containing family C protein n=1 Tax=Meriones unguiculatus TaxID=10047 RepID=UPI000B4F1EA8|nr:BPI fold-containing family C protein [Meriones unguiculatus]XP_060233791.1 BPI fold-containing family C protein [Meriones unguiculatus]